MAETLGHTTSHAVWTALESTYHHDSLKRTHTLRDSLNHLKKGTSTVAEYARKFKSICDQLTVIGHPLDENDKSHWFLCGLSSSFEMFSMTQRAAGYRQVKVLEFFDCPGPRQGVEDLRELFARTDVVTPTSKSDMVQSVFVPSDANPPKQEVNPTIDLFKSIRSSNNAIKTNYIYAIASSL
ncbi:zinc finger, CCHC-type containing LTR copia-type gag-polypeptide [Tanacetum coccineum]